MPKTHMTSAEWNASPLNPKNQGKKRRNKHNNQRTKRGAITFDSLKEAEYYDQLLLRQRAKDIAYFLRQVPFDLPGNTKYRVDFMVVYPDGKIEYIDVKGMRTKAFIRAKKQVEDLYPGTIIEA